MKLLLINPNTSVHVTERMLAQARLTAGGRAQVEGVTAEFGPAIIGSRSEHAVAAHAALALAAKHHPGFDAVVLGVSLDSGLQAVRELLDVPVVGMTEAALLTGCMLGGRLGALTLGARMLPLYEELTAAHGLASRVARWRALELPAAYGEAVDDGVALHVQAACEALVRDDGADAVLLCGAVLAGYASRIAPALPAPVIDGIAAATQQAMSLVDLGLGAHRAGSYARPLGRTLAGVGTELASRLKG